MRECLTRVLSIVLAILLCCTPQLVFASSGQATANPQAPATQTGSQSDNTQAAPSLPDAPRPAAAEAPSPTNEAPNSANTTQRPSQPQGTAAATAAKTIGGPASKPAGSAIAPAKQRQMRSLLIKIGAIAGAGAALGTVYALTRGTPNRPPGAH